MRGKTRGKEHHSWKGGRYPNYAGYRLVWVPYHHYADKNSYVMEHRLIYEDYHKCVILPWAIIHHKNGIKDDNRIENLELVSRGEHNSIHRRYSIPKDRRCCICESDKTYVRPNGLSHWRTLGQGYMCQYCYYKYNGKRYAVPKIQTSI